MEHNGVPLVQIGELSKSYKTAGSMVSHFWRTRSPVQAVDKVSFDIWRGETLGLVGESGCGKTTIGRCILRLADPVEGEIQYEGRDILSLRGRELMKQQRKMQMIFQNPHGALHPSMQVRAILAEAVKIGGCKKGEVEGHVESLLKTVQLRGKLNQYPFELSGGERRRVGIARILATQPEFIVADEPIASLDVSVRSQMLGLLKRLKRDLGLTYLYISHDIGIVKNISDRIAVMYMGRIVEIGRNTDITITECRHPYTKELLRAAKFLSILGEEGDVRSDLEIADVPPMDERPPGCSFHPRCKRYKEVGEPGICRGESPEHDMPDLKPLGKSPEHKVACWLI